MEKSILSFIKAARIVHHRLSQAIKVLLAVDRHRNSNLPLDQWILLHVDIPDSNFAELREEIHHPYRQFDV